jgi:hypothetical protein
VEGVKGFGDDFMIGKDAPIKLSKELVEQIKSIYNSLIGKVGEVKIEWVFDGTNVWVV